MPGLSQTCYAAGKSCPLSIEAYGNSQNISADCEFA